MKTVNNTKVVKSVKGKGKGKGSSLSTSDLVNALVERTQELNPSAPPVPVTPLPAPLVPGSLQMGIPNLTSRRITLRMDEIVTYRWCNNQRKPSQSGGAKYYVQGGATQIDPESGKERFMVALEIPFTDLHQAKLELVRLRSLPLPATQVA